MSFESPNQNEGLEKVKEQFALLSGELVKRKEDGQNILFTDKSEEVLMDICQRLESGDADTKKIVEDFETEMREMGKHSGSTVIDSLASLNRMAELFSSLSGSLATLNPEDSNIVRMSEISMKVADVITEKVEILFQYLNRK